MICAYDNNHDNSNINKNNNDKGSANNNNYTNNTNNTTTNKRLVIASRDQVIRRELEVGEERQGGKDCLRSCLRGESTHCL